MPRVSVILVLYGRADLALRAVAALVDNTPPCFELIIVDNDSPDDASTVVSDMIVGATIVRNPLNVGFSAAVSVGALRARGEFLLLLNSDVFVEPGWLPPLVAALEQDRFLAGVSPTLLNVDGTLQEAGSILFAGGETVAVTDEDTWALDFQRVVPYVSAACLLVRREVYSRLGGLDTAYGRGYYEDVDFALELEELGLALAHVPRSAARHVRGGSSNHESAMRQTLRNREVFIARWEDRLSTLPRIGSATVGARRRGRDELTADRILIIDDRLPHVDRGSGDPRMFRIATVMARTWPSARVTFLAASLEHSDIYSPGLLSHGVEVVPCSHDDAHEWLRRRPGHFSAVIISRPDNLVRFRSMLAQTQPQALVVVDVEAHYSQRTERQMAVITESHPAAAQALMRLRDEQREVEHVSWKAAHAVVCVCEEEAAVVRAVVPRTPVFVIQQLAEVAVHPTPNHQRHGLLFFGGFMGGELSPNTDTVGYLIDTLMPPIWAAHPELSLTVAGWNPPPSVIDRAGDRVVVVGPVADAAAVFSSHRLLLVPERFGAGIKTKLIEAMACGTPFVSSTLAAQGLHLGDLACHLVADDPERFVALTTALLNDAALWQRVHEGLLQLTRDHFSSNAFTNSLIDLMAEIGVAPPVPR